MSEKFEQMKGRAKQAAGDLTDNDELRREGRTDEQAGEFKGRVRDLADKAHDGIETAREKATDAVANGRKRSRP